MSGLSLNGPSQGALLFSDSAKNLEQSPANEISGAVGLIISALEGGTTTSSQGTQPDSVRASSGSPQSSSNIDAELQQVVQVIAQVLAELSQALDGGNQTPSNSQLDDDDDDDDGGDGGPSSENGQASPQSGSSAPAAQPAHPGNATGSTPASNSSAERAGASRLVRKTASNGAQSVTKPSQSADKPSSGTVTKKNGSTSGSVGSPSTSATGSSASTASSSSTSSKGNPTNNPLNGQVDPNKPIYIPLNSDGSYNTQALAALAKQGYASAGVTQAQAQADGGSHAGNAGTDGGTWQVSDGFAKGILYGGAALASANADGFTAKADQQYAVTQCAVETGGTGSLSGSRDATQTYVGPGDGSHGQGPIQIDSQWHNQTEANNPFVAFSRAWEIGKNGYEGSGSQTLRETGLAYNTGDASAGTPGSSNQGQIEQRYNQSMSYGAYWDLLVGKLNGGSDATS